MINTVYKSKLDRLIDPKSQLRLPRHVCQPATLSVGREENIPGIHIHWLQPQLEYGTNGRLKPPLERRLVQLAELLRV